MQLSRIIDGRKFMWDGVERASEPEAQEAAQRYRSQGFLAALVKEGDKFIVLTRRVVTEAASQGAAQS